MKAEKPIIAEIQTTELLYHDLAYVNQGYQFCRNRDIDCLPSLDNPSLFYRRNDQTKNFQPENLKPERCVSGGRFIFHFDLLEQLRTYHVLFVMDDGELTGVVHFADYNKPVVSDYLYTYLAAYERNLRQLAKLSGLSEADMGAYFRQKLQEREAAGKKVEHFQRKLTSFEQQSNQRSQTPAFQLFYLDDLLGMLKHHGVISLQNSVRELRNSVMHAHELVNMVDVTTPDYIYDFHTFEKFFQRARALLDDARRVENRIRFARQDCQ